MNGLEHDRATGVQELLTQGQEDQGEAAVGAAFPAAIDPHAGTAPVPAGRHLVVRPEDVEIVLAPEWLADLHDPTLVISRGYVGPDRRRVDRRTPGYVGPDRRRVDRRTLGYVAPDARTLRYTAPEPRTRQAGLLVRIAQVVCMTLVVAVPLTLIAARSVPPSSTATPSPATTGHKAAGPAGRHRSHVITATPQQLARADAAYQRALARQEHFATGNPEGGSGAAAMDLSAGAAAEAQQRQAQASATAQARAAYQQQAAQARAEAQAAAAQRRDQAQAARAQAQAAKAGGGGHRSGGGIPANPPGT